MRRNVVAIIVERNASPYTVQIIIKCTVYTHLYKDAHLN